MWRQQLQIEIPCTSQICDVPVAHMRRHSIPDGGKRNSRNGVLPALHAGSLAETVHTALLEAHHELNRALIAKDYSTTRSMAKTILKLLEVAQDLAEKK